VLLNQQLNSLRSAGYLYISYILDFRTIFQQLACNALIRQSQPVRININLLENLRSKCFWQKWVI